jgi:ribosome-associated heat shock protein Hsp15
VSRHPEDHNPPVADALRLDKWLWCARFYRSRGLAQAAVEGGHVQVNGERSRPSRLVRVGDQLGITRERERFEIQVTGIPARRGPATEARMHYVESEESVAARARAREFDRLAPVVSTGRPDKRDRRELLRTVKGRA